METKRERTESHAGLGIFWRIHRASTFLLLLLVGGGGGGVGGFLVVLVAVLLVVVMVVLCLLDHASAHAGLPAGARMA